MRPGEDDAELVRRARLGDRDAFAALVERHGAAMYRYARRMLHDDGAAEDCVQEALVSAWLSADRFRGEAAVRTWLFGILIDTGSRGSVFGGYLLGAALMLAAAAIAARFAIRAERQPLESVARPLNAVD